MKKLFLILIFFGLCGNDYLISQNKTMGKKELQKFVFNSGGTSHPSGYGAWNVVINADMTQINISHKVKRTIKLNITTKISKKESIQFWNKVYSLNIKKLKSSTDFAGCKVPHTFSFYKKGKTKGKTVQIWTKEVRENKELKSLVDILESFIKKYAKKKPALW